MIEKSISKKNIFFITFLFVFSVIINQYYGDKGVFPLDTFLHFDNGYRILIGEIPFRDYWSVSGPAVDYIQSIFFYFLGANWNAYVFHSSFINGLTTIFTFIVLKNFNLKINYCFLYSLLFSILAYPPSGTPFVDHHSALFSLLGVYSFLLFLKKKNKLYCLLIPIFLGLAFFSKQVPATYITFAILLVLAIYSYKGKTFEYINYFLIGLFFFIFLVLIFGKLQGIKFSDFLSQYILYPQTIGTERFANLNFTFSGLIAHFKFIYLLFVPLIYVHYKKIIESKKYLKGTEFLIPLILILLTFSLIFHQLLTKNQTFIFFLIPLLTAFSHIGLNDIEFKFKNLAYVILIFVCIFAVAKYHLRFNQDRKFHELNTVDFSLSIDAKIIDEKLKGLNWISSEYRQKPKEEINILNEIKFNLKNDKRKKMLITNYTFFSAILEENLFSPSWAITPNGTTHPVASNKYVENYGKLMIDIIKKNNIAVIYIAGSLNDEQIYNYIDRDCFKENLVSNNLRGYELVYCNNIEGQN
tara:strand:- start:12674 stop:14251 length:1578 start_codon:yes stop_codon:yes gene_type:complete